MTESTDNVVFPEPQEPALPEEVGGEAGPLSDVDPEKLAKLRERLAAFKQSDAKTISGSEDPDAPPAGLDLSQFEVDPELEHLYKRATLEETGAGKKWMAVTHQYMIHTGAWHIDGSGQMTGVNKQGKKTYRAKGLDHIITEVVNGPEGILSVAKGWRLSALLPGAMSQGIAVFERQVRQVLDDPKPIVRGEDQPLEKTTDEELARMNERAKAWEELSNKMAAEGNAQAEAREEGTDVQSEG